MFFRPAVNKSKVIDLLLNRWSVKVMLRNCSCDVMGTCGAKDQSYPILNAYLGQFEVDIVGFKQGM